MDYFKFILIGLLVQSTLFPAQLIPCDRIHNNRTCHIYNVTIGENHQTIQFQEIRQFIIESSNISYFSTDLFANLGEANFLTLKKGNVREINFSSDNLISLRIDRTGLQNLTIASTVNHNLNTLIINHNPISVLPSSIHYLMALSLLDLSRNQLTYLDLNWFQQMNNLLVLDLSWNHLALIDGSPTLRLSRLRNLWINHNHLSQIAWFPIGFPKLERVRLSENYWSCVWIRSVRRLIWEGKIHLYDFDRHCSEASEGGLCCYEALTAPSHAKFELIDIEFGSQIDGFVRDQVKEHSTIVAEQAENNHASCRLLEDKIRLLQKDKLLLEKENIEFKEQFSKKVALLQNNLVEVKKDLEESEGVISRYRFKERLNLMEIIKYLNGTRN
ncbi:uncharacterized protein LOC129777072 [Toxorhynchites rutilus septentrionalis]|uniref:uncharacterized protein LOC129777072 n=1 Tax=Toxorhynchites rutilus septentrionalis TaxID=329112 RepID=UPI00247904DC|nr:uncharacterized protein LOC129777072 [Toxorhynchites rutilus septentrionalis]